MSPSRSSSRLPVKHPRLAPVFLLGSAVLLFYTFTRRYLPSRSRRIAGISRLLLVEAGAG